MQIALQQPEFELNGIWRWPDWPEREVLTGLNGRDIGIDFVARWTTGERVAIQCTCYEDRCTLEKDEIDKFLGGSRRCCTARSKSLTSLCRLQSHPAQYVSGIPSAAILLSISHPIRCSTRCLANVRARISGPMIAL